MKSLLLVLLFVWQGMNACLAAERNIVAPLADSSAIGGCSWIAHSAALGKGYVFLAKYDLSRILMNIDGADIKLELVSTEGRLDTLGSVLNMVYRTEGVVVRASYTATWVCPETNQSESCEVTRFDATYEVSKGSRRQLVHAIGEVGC